MTGRFQLQTLSGRFSHISRQTFVKMDIDIAAKEAAAVSLLKRAVELDHKKRKTEALLCYKEGLQIFMDVLKSNVHGRSKEFSQCFLARLCKPS